MGTSGSRKKKVFQFLYFCNMLPVVEEMNSKVSHYILVAEKSTQRIIGFADIRFRIDWLHKQEPVVYM